MSEYLPRPERRTDSELINEAIERSTVEGTPISHEAARMIASLLHDGQASAAYSFASTGFIDEDRLQAEMMATHSHPATEDDVKAWIDKFAQYMVNREDKGIQERWSDRWIDGEPNDTECQRCGAPFDSPHDADCVLNPNNEEDAFYGLDVEDLPQEVKLRLADFLDEYGQAAASLLEIVGIESIDDVQRNWSDMYLGKYRSIEEYTEQYLQDTDAYRFLEDVPSWICNYVKVDTEQLSRDWLAGGSIYVDENNDGFVYIYNLTR